jgi:pilus assembly protein CpaB
MLFKMKIILPIAILTSAVSTYGVYHYLQKKKTEIEDPKRLTQSVVIAKANFDIGRMLEESDLKQSEWPKNIVPRGSYSDVSLVVGRVLKAEIYEGEAILESKLAPSGSDGGFASIIPQGMRALTVSVNTYSGVGGFILPNTRVDVLVTVPSPHNKEESSTKIILEDVKVLAVDQTFEREGDDPVIVQSVTLLVTPDEAEKLVLASTEGKLQLSLRNYVDHDTKPTSGVQLKELISNPRPRRTSSLSSTANRRQSEPKSEQTVVEVIRSSERSEVKFDDSKKKEKEENNK